jgi:GMP synthase (glutamine-hydrolysing)
MIAIVDFGSQTTHLIGRRIRDFGIPVEIIDPKEAFAKVQALKPAGIILSGGPSSVYEKGAPTIDKKIFDLGIPILGICYGWQLTAQLLGGKVVRGTHGGEYGPTTMALTHSKSALFANIDKPELTVWMSHGDEVSELPIGFDYHVSTSKVKAAAVGDMRRNIMGVQFHPEVQHTTEGTRILKNFVETVCGEVTVSTSAKIEEVLTWVEEQTSASQSAVAISAVSGGVDSTVASAIVAKVLGKRFIPVYCDNGLMREGTRQEVEYVFGTLLGIKPVIIDCRDRFLTSLKGVVDPEKKRIIIGNLYIKIFEEEAKRHTNVRWLVQGTIRSDVIESQGSKHASKIKSHHNVGGLPEEMKLSLLEPLRHHYKDEVRALGKQLGLPEHILMKHPFPGPGQAIRILGEVTVERLAKQQLADQIVMDILHESGWYDRVFQGFPIMTGAMSTAVKGDGRVYGEIVGLRIYDGSEIMTAGWTHLPYEILQHISSRIVNEIPDVSRVVYDITTKPPATMEWE